MLRFLSLLCALLALVPAALRAEPADIDAAARGVVRVVIMGTDGEEVYPIGHGTGFAVTPTRIVTNAHVISEALLDDELRIGVVPSEGDEAVYAKVVAVAGQKDLALIELTGDLRLSPLTLAGGTTPDSGEVSAVGYPMNVDRAQGLSIGDIFKSQPPVKARGFVSGSRPSRQFDTVLHTAPIAQGNSGGPLLDPCGRVLGANSFGADASAGDAEFFFAVSAREIIPFLRANGVEPRVTSLPCRSMAELDAEERERIEREQEAARAALDRTREDERLRFERARFEAEMAVLDERDDRMLGAVLLLMVGAGLAWWALEKRPAAVTNDDGDMRRPWPTQHKLALAGAAACVVGAIVVHLTRPGVDEVDRRLELAMGGGDALASDGGAGQPGARTLVCTLDTARSRVTGVPAQSVRFDWTPEGCVNGRTQYGLADGVWSRVFVPEEENTVSVNTFNPDSGTYRTDRYLLGRSEMDDAREARRQYSAPKCDAADASTALGERQSAVLATLPSRPNERLVYVCEAES